MDSFFPIIAVVVWGAFLRPALIPYTPSSGKSSHKHYFFLDLSLFAFNLRHSFQHHEFHSFNAILKIKRNSWSIGRLMALVAPPPKSWKMLTMTIGGASVEETYVLLAALWYANEAAPIPLLFLLTGDLRSDHRFRNWKANGGPLSMQITPHLLWVKGGGRHFKSPPPPHTQRVNSLSTLVVSD